VTAKQPNDTTTLQYHTTSKILWQEKKPCSLSPCSRCHCERVPCQLPKKHPYRNARGGFHMPHAVPSFSPLASTRHRSNIIQQPTQTNKPAQTRLTRVCPSNAMADTILTTHHVHNRPSQHYATEKGRYHDQGPPTIQQAIRIAAVRQ